MIRAWCAARRSADERKVLAAIAMLRPSEASGSRIGQVAHLRSGRTYAALSRLESRGEVTWEWVAGPRQCRVYRLVDAGARS